MSNSVAYLPEITVISHGSRIETLQELNWSRELSYCFVCEAGCRARQLGSICRYRSIQFIGDARSLFVVGWIFGACAFKTGKEDSKYVVVGACRKHEKNLRLLYRLVSTKRALTHPIVQEARGNPAIVFLSDSQPTQF